MQPKPQELQTAYPGRSIVGNRPQHVNDERGLLREGVGIQGPMLQHANPLSCHQLLSYIQTVSIKTYSRTYLAET